MKTILVANWKSNPAKKVEAKKLFDSIKKAVKNIRNIETIICPPFVYIPELKSDSVVKIGAQNCFWAEGAFTGEISANQLKDLGCQYVILGHSERRVFGETDEVINKKIKIAIKAGLKVIFCFGETKEERENGDTQKVLMHQIDNGLKTIKNSEIKNLILAYEPIWAIGTGIACDPEEIQTIGLFLRKTISQKYSFSLGKEISILYGGSVNKNNAKDYIAESKMSGLLIGGSSLVPSEFIAIAKSI